MASISEEIETLEAQLKRGRIPLPALEKVLALARKEASRPRATCHPDELHKAKGLCEKCYAISLARAKGVKPRQTRPPGTCPHPERKRHCRGMCKNCYTYDMNHKRLPKLEDEIDTEYIAEEMDFLRLNIDEAASRFGVDRDLLARTLRAIDREDLVS